MALVRVYCGLAAAPPRSQAVAADPVLTVALMDDAGRLLDVCNVDDDPKGYAHLSTLLAERATGPYSVATAADSDQHLVARLLVAAGWTFVATDDSATDSFADRFADDLVDEAGTRPRERRALGLARALHAGALAATTLPAPTELADLKPVLAADGALANGRYGAAVALREVLRELYPAALRAYPDPADPVALAVMDALPEPGTLIAAAGGRGRDAAAAADTVTAQLTAEGVADAATIGEAITALRVAIAETPRRSGVTRALAPTIADTVRQAVSAVRACDEARAALVGALDERVRHAPAPRAATAAPRLQPAPQSDPPQPAPQPVAPQPAQSVPPPPAPRQPEVQPAATSQTGWSGYRPEPAPAMSGRSPVSAPSSRPTSAPPPPPGITPIAEPRAPLPGQRSAEQPAAAAHTPQESHRAEIRVPTPRPTPDGPPLGSRSQWPTNPPPADDWAAPAPARSAATPAPRPAAPAAATPPWRADDLEPPEPPALRLVEPTLPEELREDFGYQSWSDPPPLRLVDPEEGIPRSAPPVDADMNDDDLLIFAQARSAWFSDPVDESAWSSSVDAAWQAAEQAMTPAVGDETEAGLPRRVPHANLVPGSPPSDEDRQLRVVRDPASIAAHTSGYFNGWRRGQEVGGYPLGNRTSRPGAGAWDFARDHHAS